jgi:SAM-dependent methyltransferase
VKLPRSFLQPSAGFLLEDQAKMASARNYFAWQGRLVMEQVGRRVVEVGCGIGNFTGMLLDREVVIALDSEVECVERLKARYSEARNLHVFCGDAGDDGFRELVRFHPDSFVCLNVLEHIADDRKTLSAMAGMLSPGGVIVLLVPAFEGLYGPIDHNLGHYRRYTRQSMLELARSAGLSVKKAQYMNAVGFFGWWANSRLFHRTEQSRWQIVFFDKFVVPILSRLERVVPPPFGQSLFVVLSKPVNTDAAC